MERLKIDSYVADTQALRLNYNIWATLEEILVELKKLTGDKPQEEPMKQAYKCDRCGKEFDEYKKLRGHKIKCRG